MTGTIVTVAGSGEFGFSGDGNDARQASMYRPTGIAMDSTGNLFVIDGNRVRVIRLQSNVISTIAGTGEAGYAGDGGPATLALLNLPTDLAVDSGGKVYIADPRNNSRIRLLIPQQMRLNSVTNAASNVTGSISPGEIVVIYGSGLGPGQLTPYHIGSSGLVDAQLASTQVTINGTPAPVIYTSATQVAAVVPYSVSSGTAQVTVTFQGQTAAAVSVPVASSSPGVFTLDSTGKGAAACINQDGSINTVFSPAKVGDIIACFATGEGQTSPSGVNGKPALVPLPQPILPVTVNVGGQTAKPQYAGGAPGEVAGVMQVNFHIPTGIQTGNAVPLLLTVGNASSQSGVTIAVR